jgi:hypothetical protein
VEEDGGGILGLEEAGFAARCNTVEPMGEWIGDTKNSARIAILV